MITESVLQRALELATENGADFAEVFAEDTTSNNVTMMDGKVESATTARVTGVGIRVLKGTQSPSVLHTKVRRVRSRYRTVTCLIASEPDFAAR